MVTSALAGCFIIVWQMFQPKQLHFVEVHTCAHKGIPGFQYLINAELGNTQNKSLPIPTCPLSPYMLFFSVLMVLESGISWLVRFLSWKRDWKRNDFMLWSYKSNLRYLLSYLQASNFELVYNTFRGQLIWAYLMT